jgi:hypothetical protein
MSFIVHTYALAESANFFNTYPETFEMNTPYGGYNLSFQPMLEQYKNELMKIIPVRRISKIM